MDTITFQPLFELGHVRATPGAMDVLTDEMVASVLIRHITGDWGDLGEEDKQENAMALRTGERIFSKYNIGDGEAIYVITESDRSATTLMLPEEY